MMIIMTPLTPAHPMVEYLQIFMLMTILFQDIEINFD